MRSRRADEIAKGRDKSAALHRGCWMALWADLERRCPGISEPLYEFETSAAGWAPYVDVEGVLQALADRDVPVVIVSDVAFESVALPETIANVTGSLKMINPAASAIFTEIVRFVPGGTDWLFPPEIVIVAGFNAVNRRIR